MKNPREALFRELPFGFRARSRANVDDGCDDTSFAGKVDQSRGVNRVKFLAGFSAKANLQLIRAAFATEKVDELGAAFEIRPNTRFDGCLADDFFAFKTKHPETGFVCFKIAAIAKAAKYDRHGTFRKHRCEQRLRLAQFLVRNATPADISNQPDETLPAGNDHLRENNLYRQLATVAPTCRGLDTAPIDLLFSRRDVLLHAAPMRGMQGLGLDCAQGCTNQFLGRIVKHGLACRIRVSNDAFAVNDQHGVVRRLPNGAKPILAFAQCTLCGRFLQ